ncbi:hypothetical protein [Haloarchaeobius iranensis]|uniref:hypothetical protein n=1 Tax=Haloarchaeobius iranensis TaxID=996166 RepID=UPI001113E54B|nr:hypothetical protein [Haloarchaeobius iranensis]
MSSPDYSNLSTCESRLAELKALGIPEAALQRYLQSRNLPIPDGVDDFKKAVAEELSAEQIRDILTQYKYAGRQTLNYFVITGLSKYSYEELVASVEDEFPVQDDVENVSRKPFMSHSEREGPRLYLTFGYYESTGGVEITTGKRKPELTTQRAVGVVRPDTDLLEIRTSDPDMAEKIRDGIVSSMGQYKSSSTYRPDFGGEFRRQFNSRVEKYYNLRVQVEDDEDSTIDTISFTSKKDETGERRDAREDDRVAKELEGGGEITIGYVELADGFKFQINRKQSKVSILKSEREENINAITEIIDGVLRETDGYTQGTLGGLTDVPE